MPRTSGEPQLGMEFHEAASLAMVSDARRLTALRRLALLDTEAEMAFDRLTRLAVLVLDVPVALVTLVDEDRQFFKSCIGLPEPWASRRETPLSHSFCQYTLAGRPLVVDDARSHPILRDNLAIHDLNVVAYAGFPLLTQSGEALGSFCAIDTKPRAWSESDLSVLEDLTKAAMTEIELRAKIQEAEQQAGRMGGLQHVTESLSGALTPSQVAEVVLDQGLLALGADGGIVGALDNDRKHLRIIAFAGYKIDLHEHHSRIPIEAPLPIVEAARMGHAVLLGSSEEMRARYAGEDLEPYRVFHESFEAVAAVPLMVDGDVTGALALRFQDRRTFEEDEEAFFETLARQCAQALERARLFEAEQQARAHVERLAREREAILGQSAEGIIISDAEGRISFVNEAARRIHGVAKLGVPVEEYADTYHLLTLDGAPYPGEELPLARAVLRGETVIDEEWRIRRPDGTEVIAQGSASPVRTEDGTQLGAVLVMHDATTRHDLLREKEEFLSDVAHDLQNPLASIKGFAQILQRQAKRGVLQAERVVQSAGHIEAATVRMQAFLQELLDVARMEMGHPVTLHRQSVDLVALAWRAVSSQEQHVDGHHLRVQSDVPEVRGMWDERRLERVLINLVSNAIKYSPSGGAITVTVRREHGADRDVAAVEVRDSGIGIPEQDLPFVTHRFKRASNVGASTPGTGLGLAGAKQLIEQHGGTLAIRSREGEGTTVTIRLPSEDSSEQDSSSG